MSAPEEQASRPFVGRESELALLRAALAEATTGRPRCVLVTGEAGIGKTRIVERLVADLAPEAVHWGRAHETEGAPAYWPWSQVIRSLVRRRSPEQVLDLAGVDAGELVRMVPSLGRAGVELARPDDGDRETARFRLFDAVASLVRRIGEERLVAIVLEDLHWADSESLLLLDYVASELRETKLLLVGTYRDFDGAAPTAAPRLLAGLARVSERIALRGLAAQEIAGLLHRVGPGEPSAGLVEAVHRATGGNPFFVGEIAALLREDAEKGTPGELADGFRVPDTVREAIRRRLDPLPAATRDLLRRAAVLGLDALLDPLGAISESSSAQVLAELEPALRAGVMAETRRPGRYRFAHALLQQSLLEELSAVDRARLHLRAGEALERLYAADPTPILGELAHHFRQAAAFGTSGKAVEYATRAGDRAIASLGFEEAAGHYERALQSERGSGSDPARRLDLLLKFGDAQRWAGDEDGAHATLFEAARLARERGDRVALGRAAVRVVASTAETGFIDHAVVELLEAALAGLASPEHAALRARVLGALARTLYFAPDPARREALSREAVEVARAAGQPAVLAAVLTDRHFALWRPGTVEERLALIDETIALAVASGYPDTVAEARAWRILDLIELDRFDEADREIGEHVAWAARTRIPRSLWHATLVRAARALFDGRIDEAETLADEALQARTTRTRNNAVQFHALQMFYVRRAQGRLHELAPDLAEVAGRPGTPPIWRCGVAQVDLVSGRTDEARAQLAELVDDGFAPLPRDSTWLPALASLAELAAALDDRERAALIHAELLPYRGLVIVSGYCAVIQGSVDRALGIAELAMGRADEAVRSLEAAVHFATRIGAKAELVRTEHALALALRARGRSGDAARADALAASAQATAAALGAPGLVAGLAPPASSAAVPSSRPAPPLRPAPALRPAPRALLRREGDFWTLACDDEMIRLKDTKGVGYLATLLSHPGEDIHALDLARSGEVRLADGDSGEALDAEAARAYRRRLAELTPASEGADGAEAERLRQEREALERELARATGLGGRARRTGSDAERARLNVTRAIGAVVKKVAAECPRLGRHLETSVRTGTFCCYEPEPGSPRWER